MEFIKWGQKQVRQFALNLTETEIRVEEATNNDAWGPHGSVMAEIAEEARDIEKYREIMSVIARRLMDTGENWRHVYKALLLLEYLLRHGPQKVARDTQANTNVLQDLLTFEFKDKNGRDQGINVRNRAKEILALLSDKDALTEAREKARMNRNKYQGASKDHARFLGSGSPTVTTQSLPKRVVYEQKTSDNDEDDPFEATRKRIEKLKASEQEITAEVKTASSATTIKVSLPQQQKKEPKKLSQVKMNPDIAATFLKAPPTAAAAPAAVAPPVTTGSTMPDEQPPAPEDLLGDLTADVLSVPADIMQPTAKPVEVTDDMFDVLAAPVHVPEVVKPAEEEWADFSAVSTAPVPKEISLNDLLQPDQPATIPLQPMTVGTTATTATTAAIKSDPFADLCGTKRQQTRVPMGAGKGIASFATTQTQTQTAPTGDMMNGSNMNAPTPWMPTPAPAPVQQQHAPPVAHFSTNGIQGMGLGSAGWGQHPGAPMNSVAAVASQKAAVRKEDPFANLGF